jgi:hypothetical protein
MWRSLVLGLALMSCGGEDYDSYCNAGGPPCGDSGVDRCTNPTSGSWQPRQCLPGDKCIDAETYTCEAVKSAD